MNKILKVDNIMYRVKDLEKAENFYVNVFGLKKVWEDKKRKMAGFILEKSDSEIVIHNNSELPKFDYSFLVESVDKFVKEYKAKGYKPKLEPIEVRCGKYAILLDLDGNGIPIIDLTKFGNKPRYN